MKKTTLVLIMLVFAAVSYCTRKTEREGINIHSVVGDVKLLTAKGELSPKAGDPVSMGDGIVTAGASMIDLVYADRGIIRIGENSNVKVEELFSDAEKDNARFGMEKGAMLASISRLSKNSSFEVKSSTSVAAVRGTTFRVIAGDKSSKIDVVKGRVRVTPVHAGKLLLESAAEVETNRAVALDVEAVTGIAEKKKAVEVTVIPKEEVKAIREELKSLPGDAAVADEVLRETREIITAPAQDEAEAEKDNAVKEEKRRPERKAAVKRKDEVKQQDEKQEVTGVRDEKKSKIPLAPNL